MAETLAIMNYGQKNGVQIFRINGQKEQLYRIISECRDMGHKFDDTPLINHSYKNQWTLLLKIKVPVAVAHND